MSRMLNGLFVIEVQAPNNTPLFSWHNDFVQARIVLDIWTYDRSELAILVTKTENENGLLHLKVHFDKPFR
jgi:hypothetical protein